MTARTADGGTLRVAVVPFGCKVSRIEAGALSAILSRGEAVSPAAADVVVVHGCAVTDRSERDQRRALRRLKRENARARLVVSGCLSRHAPETFARMPEVDLVVDPEAAGDLPALLTERESGLLPEKVVRRADGPRKEIPAVAFPDASRTRAFLKVQDGCERRCAFCVVPFLRGNERSAEPRALEEEIRRLGASGVPEVVLAGVHLANYGKDRGTRLLDLLVRLEKAPPGCRLRLSSLEPMEAGEALLHHVAASRVVVPHLHLPLQSGSDAVLRRMRRGITVARFRALAALALRANTRLHLATDLIAGFPGETDAEFEETARLVGEIPFGSLHVFPFSPRRGTRGAELHAAAAVPSGLVARRAAHLRRLGEGKARSFRRAADGTLADAVVLRGGIVLTDNYLEAPLDLPSRAGKRLAVRLTASGSSAALRAGAVTEAGSISAP